METPSRASKGMIEDGDELDVVDDRREGVCVGFLMTTVKRRLIPFSRGEE